MVVVLTHVELRSTDFPAYESEFEEVNPGRFGKRLAEYLAQGLREQNESVEELFCEDWGWVVPISNDKFNLWIGVGNYDEYEDGFLCFIEPHKEYVRYWLKKIPTKERVELLRKRLDQVLQSHPGIRDIKWWTHDEFMFPSA